MNPEIVIFLENRTSNELFNITDLSSYIHYKNNVTNDEIKKYTDRYSDDNLFGVADCTIEKVDDHELTLTLKLHHIEKKYLCHCDGCGGLHYKSNLVKCNDLMNCMTCVASFIGDKPIMKI